MITRDAQAVWHGNLKNGNGTLRVAGRDLPYTFASRFEQGDGTNPEELIGAAHAGCFSMALSNMLAKAGHEPESGHTTAEVHLDKDKGAIVKIILRTKADVPGIDQSTFDEHAANAKANCPISKTLANVEIVLEEAVLQS
ncbi:MAG: OsmC family protein [Rhodothermales bacterium]|nr:OsmC family protein [Rhodothermales bacterium]